MTRHVVGENAVEEGPNARHVALRSRHVDVDRPQVPAFRMRVHDTLENRFATFRITELVFELSEFRNGFQIYGSEVQFSGDFLNLSNGPELTFVLL